VNLVTRGVTPEPATAALAAAAALRALDAAGVEAPAVWVARGVRFDATAAWDHGIALVRVANVESEAAAHGVVRAVGARIVLSAKDLRNIGGPRGDGARLAARHELCLWPDEHVEVIFGADRDPALLTARLDSFERHIAAEPDTPRRLVLAALTRHGARLSEPMLRAILHPLVLVEIAESDDTTVALLRAAADAVTPNR
jgi:hypothetical protein